MLDIQQYNEDIVAICKSLSVKRLYLVGSAARDDFNEEKSDLDVLVEFEGQERLFYRYFDLKEKLEALLGRNVDIIQPKAVKNPYVQRNLERDKVVIYGT